ncbi:hypothetical protein [Bradyrhizobium sp. 76]|uniref:hypothetical protein n=1 Tax=Bradyrhizobium sp. 76 TaxID=2782680 RepID=UPI001FFA3AE9|nr:hypothetical protein [Bradyrhizobium sp. 76]MCK1405276.1 hypothetical protein [Bradyrhizobium sp. 76]
MSIAALRNENERLKALLVQTQSALSEHQGALAASEEAQRRLEVILGEWRVEPNIADDSVAICSSVELGDVQQIL